MSYNIKTTVTTQNSAVHKHSYSVCGTECISESSHVSNSVLTLTFWFFCLQFIIVPELGKCDSNSRSTCNPSTFIFKVLR